MPTLTSFDLTSFLPEIILVAGTLVLVIFEIARRKMSAASVGWGGRVLLALLVVVALSAGSHLGSYFFGSLVDDGVAVFFKVFFALATLLAMGICAFTFRKEGEPYLLLLSSAEAISSILNHEPTRVGCYPGTNSCVRS